MWVVLLSSTAKRLRSGLLAKSSGFTAVCGFVQSAAV